MLISEEPTRRYMFERCPSIERLSIKDCAIDEYDFEEPESELPPQEDLVKMVRNHPSLRWLRSDLSAENVAMLQQERPEINFVSEQASPVFFGSLTTKQYVLKPYKSHCYVTLIVFTLHGPLYCFHEANDHDDRYYVHRE